jgi:hypothetical protein
MKGGVMKPVYQTILEPPRGNCFSACVASIFEVSLEDVPNFINNEPVGAWFFNWNEWLQQYNLRVESFAVPDGDLPWCPAWFIGGVDSPRGPWLHAVVYEGQEMKHDPWPNHDGTSPFQYRFVHDFMLFYPLDPAKPSSIPKSGKYAGQHDLTSS